MAKHAASDDLANESKKAWGEPDIEVNTATARADDTWNPLQDNYMASEFRDDQANTDTVYEPWRLGQDRDGNETRPKEWKLYDPVVLPIVSSRSYHDSAGVNKLPGQRDPWRSRTYCPSQCQDAHPRRRRQMASGLH